MSYYITFYIVGDGEGKADAQRDCGPYRDAVQITYDQLRVGDEGRELAHYRHYEQAEVRAAWVTSDGEEWSDFVVWFKDDDDEVEYADDRDARLDYERLAQYEGDNLKEDA